MFLARLSQEVAVFSLSSSSLRLNSNVVLVNDSDSRARHFTRNMTRMVISSLFLNALGQIPYSVCFFIQQLTGLNEPLFNATQAANVFLLLPSSFEVIFYYSFNILFRSVIDGYFQKISNFFNR